MEGEAIEETLEERNRRVLAELEERARKHEDLTRYVTMRDVSEALGVRDRLLARARSKIFKTELEDDAGKIVIETRMMTSSERYQATNQLKAIQDMEAQPDMDRYAEAVKALNELLADVVVTPGLREYFLEGEVTDDVTMALISRTLEGTVTAVGDSVERFREE